MTALEGRPPKLLENGPILRVCRKHQRPCHHRPKLRMTHKNARIGNQSERRRRAKGQTAAISCAFKDRMAARIAILRALNALVLEADRFISFPKNIASTTPITTDRSSIKIPSGSERSD